MWRVGIIKSLNFRQNPAIIKSHNDAIRGKSNHILPVDAVAHFQTKLHLEMAKQIQTQLLGVVEGKAAHPSGSYDKTIFKKLSNAQKSSHEERAKAQLEAFNVATSNALGCYADACKHNKELILANKKLKNYKEKWKFKLKNYDSAKFGTHVMFEKFFDLVATLGKFKDWKFIYSTWQAQRNVEFSDLCIMHSFRLFGSDLRVEDISDFLSHHQISENSLKIIYSNITFIMKQKSEFLKGVQAVFPNFEPPDVSLEEDLYSNIDILKNMSKTKPNLSSPLPDYNKSLFEKQIDMESQDFTRIRSILPVDHEAKVANSFIEVLINDWKNVLNTGVDKHINSTLMPRSDMHQKRITVYPFFKYLDASEISDILLHKVINNLKMSETYSSSVTQFQLELANSFIRRVHVKVNSQNKDYFNNFQSVYANYVDWLKKLPSEDNFASSQLQAFLKFAKKQEQENGVVIHNREVLDWPFSIKLAIGRELLDIIMHRLTVKCDQEGKVVIGDQSVTILPDGKVSACLANGDKGSFPIFFRLFRTRQKDREIEELKPHPALAKLFAADKFTYLDFDTRELPMVVPPLPWISSSMGGYLLSPSDLIRTSNEKFMDPGDIGKKLFPVFDSLNQLGTTPWKINQNLFDIIVDVFINQAKYSNYLDMLEIPKHQSMLDAPKNPPQPELTEYGWTGVPRNLRRYQELLLERKLYDKVKNECFSLWCDALYRLSIANHFRHDTLYFPHNMDFRGRVYPIAPYLNHMGADLARSLLVFALGKPLGPDGLKWLKLHTVNLTGLKKRCSIEERLEYAEQILPDIIDSVTNPFGGKQWWLKSETPWQTLGACMELKGAIDSGDPENFVSHLPIHQDGSCNGLQHYAALGRDVLGAKAVNLLPADSPQDIYSEVAEIVERKRAEDANAGKEIAQILEGHVYRKIIKQTVMTTVYGVTMYGAANQIARQLKSIETLPCGRVGAASKYLAVKTFDSLNEMFHSSQKIQSWLTTSAHIISGELNDTVSWSTPLGLNVSQPYFKTVKVLNTSQRDELCSVDKFLSQRFNIYSKPNNIKQRNGFPPNFIHSLDSTHMMLTSLEMWNQGRTFASVHDCFWTHASSVPTMNKICREQFVNLHNYPILESLSQDFMRTLRKHHEETSHKGDANYAKAKITFEALPEKGELELEKVKDSTYFFS